MQDGNLDDYDSYSPHGGKSPVGGVYGPMREVGPGNILDRLENLEKRYQSLDNIGEDMATAHAAVIAGFGALAAGAAGVLSAAEGAVGSIARSGTQASDIMGAIAAGAKAILGAVGSLSVVEGLLDGGVNISLADIIDNLQNEIAKAAASGDWSNPALEKSLRDFLDNYPELNKFRGMYPSPDISDLLGYAIENRTLEITPEMWNDLVDQFNELHGNAPSLDNISFPGESEFPGQGNWPGMGFGGLGMNHERPDNSTGSGNSTSIGTHERPDNSTGGSGSAGGGHGISGNNTSSGGTNLGGQMADQRREPGGSGGSGTTTGGTNLGGQLADQRREPGGSTTNTPGTVSGTNSQTSNDPDTSPVSPVLLDLDGNGVKITEFGNSTQFTAGKDGLQHRSSWAGAGDGVLFFDPDGRNAITEQRQYVFTDWAPTAAGDLEAIRQVWDSNGDGKLTAADAEFAKFKVMVTNADGFQTRGPCEMRQAA